MSTALQFSAPASSSPTRNCGKHPQERVVGVCSACLASKLASLGYSSTAFAPGALDTSCARASLTNSLPSEPIDSPSHHHHRHQEHLQTIDEEGLYSAKGFDRKGRVSSALVDSLTPVECCADADIAADNNCVTFKTTTEQLSVSHDEIEEEKPSIVSQDNSSIGSLEAGNPKSNPYLRANQPIKCKRSKSLCALRGDSFSKLEHEAHALDSAATVVGHQTVKVAKKVTLRTLFQLDNEDKWRNRALVASEAWESERFSADDDKPEKEESNGGSIPDPQKIEEAKGVCHTHSHRCVPSASALSSSVCPSMSCKLKHSALLNSLLCRKTGDERQETGSISKPSQVYEACRQDFIRSFHEGRLTEASNDIGFIRATYIASESREALRRCKSKPERSVARSSVSSSQPEESPPCNTHGVDMMSERKFNRSARALAAELPLLLGVSPETAEGTDMIPCKAENPAASASHVEDCEEVLSMIQEQKHLALNAAVLECEIREALENGAFSGNRRNDHGDVEVEHVEMPLSGCSDDYPSIPQAHAVKDNLENEPGSSGTVTIQDAAAMAEIGDGMPKYITVVEEGSQGALPMGCRSLSDSASFGKPTAAARQAQGTKKLAEEVKKGGGWEVYSSNSGSSVRRWPSSSSRTGKIMPAQSGLLRFYLTPLRASGRARISAARRARPKHLFWPLIFM